MALLSNALTGPDCISGDPVVLDAKLGPVVGKSETDDFDRSKLLGGSIDL